MQALQNVFSFQDKQVRVVLRDGEPWFVARDVCEVLDHSDTSTAIRRLDDDEKLTQTMFVSGQNREVWLVNEPGLYSLILTSRKPEAKAFKRWITHEVIPAIRKTGAYAVDQSKVVPLSERQALIQSLKLTAELAEEMEEVKSITQTHSQKLMELEQKVEEQITIDHGEQRILQQAVARRVYEVESDPQRRRELFRQLYREIKDRWGVPSYRDVRRSELQQVLRYVEAWMPRRTA
ncbi:BRO family protein [Brevibacillus aydinogluensis]|uniref:Phage antirepressor n=1 Tax=Brevibacillus aydinogluensis TaxID=927786 RepID=A0AA48M7M2_9BACL|nr:BRO family protein [Brevibacillus aydinogluensis]CAJ1000994.1 Phage antirepressor [Brevibacillus aydinogluensis]